MTAPRKRKAILCDLDGTLFIIGDRDPFDVYSCGLDAVNQAVLTVVKWATAYGYDVLFTSGRGFRELDRYYTELTLAWHEIPYTWLFTRNVGDARKDYVVKKEMYRDEIQPYWDIAFVLDDRGSVCRMWREEEGLTVFRVDERLD